jgi:hypothetical protein
VVAVRPQRRKAGSAHYAYKLAFLDAVRTHAAQEAEALGRRPLGLLGDFNVAPTDADVWDPALLAGGTHVSAAERAALEELRTGVGPDGLADLLPRASHAADDVRHPWTFWEMRMLGFQKGRGMRLDLALVNPALAARVTDVWVDRDARRGQGPSDHAPLVLDLDSTTDCRSRPPRAPGLWTRGPDPVDECRPGPSCSTAIHRDVDRGWMGYALRETLTSLQAPDQGRCLSGRRESNPRSQFGSPTKGVRRRPPMCVSAGQSLIISGGSLRVPPCPRARGTRGARGVGPAGARRRLGGEGRLDVEDPA